MTRNHFTPRKLVHVLSHRYTLIELCLMRAEAVSDGRGSLADACADAVGLQIERTCGWGSLIEAGMLASIKRKEEDVGD